MNTPYSLAFRNRRRTHVSTIVKLHVLDGVVTRVEPYFRPDSATHPTIKIPHFKPAREACTPVYIEHDHDEVVERADGSMQYVCCGELL